MLEGFIVILVFDSKVPPVSSFYHNSRSGQCCPDWVKESVPSSGTEHRDVRQPWQTHNIKNPAKIHWFSRCFYKTHRKIQQFSIQNHPKRGYGSMILVGPYSSQRLAVHPTLRYFGAWQKPLAECLQSSVPQTGRWARLERLCRWKRGWEDLKLDEMLTLCFYFRCEFRSSFALLSKHSWVFFRLWIPQWLVFCCFLLTSPLAKRIHSVQKPGFGASKDVLQPEDYEVMAKAWGDVGFMAASPVRGNIQGLARLWYVWKCLVIFVDFMVQVRSTRQWGQRIRL